MDHEQDETAFFRVGSDEDFSELADLGQSSASPRARHVSDMRVQTRVGPVDYEDQWILVPIGAGTDFAGELSISITKSALDDDAFADLSSKLSALEGKRAIFELARIQNDDLESVPLTIEVLDKDFAVREHEA